MSWKNSTLEAEGMTWREWSFALMLGAAFLLAIAWRLGWMVGLG